jgi:hypothetical protein
VKYGRSREALEDYVENDTQRKTYCVEYIVYDSGWLILLRKYMQMYASLRGIQAGDPDECHT